MSLLVLLDEDVVFTSDIVSDALCTGTGVLNVKARIQAPSSLVAVGSLSASSRIRVSCAFSGTSTQGVAARLRATSSQSAISTLNATYRIDGRATALLTSVSTLNASARIESEQALITVSSALSTSPPKLRANTVIVGTGSLDAAARLRTSFLASSTSYMNGNWRLDGRATCRFDGVGTLNAQGRIRTNSSLVGIGILSPLARLRATDILLAASTLTTVRAMLKASARVDIIGIVQAAPRAGVGVLLPATSFCAATARLRAYTTLFGVGACPATARLRASAPLSSTSNLYSPHWVLDGRVQAFLSATSLLNARVRSVYAEAGCSAIGQLSGSARLVSDAKCISSSTLQATAEFERSALLAATSALSTNRARLVVEGTLTGTSSLAGKGRFRVKASCSSPSSLLAKARLEGKGLTSSISSLNSNAWLRPTCVLAAKSQLTSDATTDKALSGELEAVTSILPTLRVHHRLSAGMGAAGSIATAALPVAIRLSGKLLPHTDLQAPLTRNYGFSCTVKVTGTTKTSHAALVYAFSGSVSTTATIKTRIHRLVGLTGSIEAIADILPAPLHVKLATDIELTGSIEVISVLEAQLLRTQYPNAPPARTCDVAPIDTICEIKTRDNVCEIPVKEDTCILVAA